MPTWLVVVVGDDMYYVTWWRKYGVFTHSALCPQSSLTFSFVVILFYPLG